MDRLDILRTFIMVADKGSFAEAARALRVSPTAASRAIAALEEELGVPMFRRTTRSVALTDEGGSYLERCRLAVGELDDAARSLRGESAEPHGMLVVAAPVVFGRMHVAPIVATLLRKHSKLDVRLSLMDRVVRIVDEGIDVAVRIADLADSALHAQRVAEVRRVLVASPAYLSARSTPKAITDLHDHDLIAFDVLSASNEWRFAGPGRAAIRFEPRLLTNDVTAAIEAAINGLGIVRALSYQVVHHIAEKRLTCVLDKFAPPPVPVNLVYPANRQRSANVRAFLEVAKAYFRTQAF
ncbi:MAG: LysR family transcriptional regulator [Alphaproteobacteria bacterium]|nr:LysR family transcriptional regulator [Alphaproteobacteria bacterium]